MRRIRWVLMMAALASVPPFGGPAEALQLDPLGFSSLGTLNATSDILINSDTLQLTGGASFTGVTDPVSHAAVFTFDQIQTGHISIVGTAPLALLSKGNITFDGTVMSSTVSELEVAAAGNIAVNGTLSTTNGSSLTLFGGDLHVQSGGPVPARIISAGSLSIATVPGLVVENPAPRAGNIMIASSGNQFSTFSQFTVSSGQVALFSATIGSGEATIVPRGVTFEPSVIIGETAPVPVPAAAVLFATGMAVVGGLSKRRRRQLNV